MKSKLDKIFDSETEKILNTLIDNPDREFNKSELAEEAGISRDALYRRWDDLEELEVVTEVENKYTLNEDTDLIETLKSVIETLKQHRQE